MVASTLRKLNGLIYLQSPFYQHVDTVGASKAFNSVPCCKPDDYRYFLGENAMLEVCVFAKKGQGHIERDSIGLRFNIRSEFLDGPLDI